MGGAGLASPALIASLIIFVTFFAIITGADTRCCRVGDSAAADASREESAGAALLLLHATPSAEVAPKLKAADGRHSSSAKDRSEGRRWAIVHSPRQRKLRGPTLEVKQLAAETRRRTDVTDELQLSFVWHAKP